MSRIAPRQRLLHLRVLALDGITTGYAPHWDAIDRLLDTPVTKLGTEAKRIDYLAWHYRAQIRADLVPWGLYAEATICGDAP